MKAQDPHSPAQKAPASAPLATPPQAIDLPLDFALHAQIVKDKTFQAATPEDFAKLTQSILEHHGKAR